ncbi:hypothetical protein, partial [uncultured Alistipes sp.]|uniref:hypothetical protein n=1 Tax=uncultured Alistipes sp. TaxID=538949 RepID=UPI00261AABD8
SRTPANHRQSTLICGGKDTPFFTNIPNFFGGIFKTFFAYRTIALLFSTLQNLFPKQHIQYT